MVIMFVWYILNLLSQVTSNINCVDSKCTSCSKGFLFNKVSCLPRCPSGYITSNKTCTLDESQELLTADFYDFSTFSAIEFKNFSHPSKVPFNDQRRLTPVPTKSQGFLFNSTSGLLLESDIVMAPDFCLIFTVFAFADGIIFQIVKDSMVFFSVSSRNLSLYLEANYTNGDSSKIFELNSTFKLNSWNKIRIANTQLIDSVFLNIIGITNLTVAGYEFRVPYDNMSLIFGSLENKSFSGFIYHAKLMNVNRCSLPPSFRLSCKFNQFLSGSGCFDCPSPDMWPPCVRNSSNLCFTELCSSCTGYNLEECTNCSDPSLDFCLKAKDCVNGTAFNCSLCNSNTNEMFGLCLSGKILNYSIDITFNHTSGYYGDFFQSGLNRSTYYFLNSPELDDPIPLKNRGLFFNNSRFLYSDYVFLNISFTITTWIYPRFLTSVLKKSTFEFWSDGMLIVRLRNYKDFTTQEALNSCDKSFWKFIGAVIKYSKGLTTITTYCGDIEYHSYSVYGFAFYDEFTKIEIKPTYDIYIYKLTIRPYALLSLKEDSVICNGIYYDSSCLLNGTINNYYNTKYNAYFNCNEKCTNGCNTWETCNICKNITCDECQDYQSDCNLNSSYDPCIDETELNIYKSSCCSKNCTDCFERFSHTCYQCKNGFYLLDNMCYKECPAGFFISGLLCSNKSYVIISIIFNKIELNPDNSSDIKLMIKSKDDLSMQTNPIPAKNRGFYFQGFSYIYSNEIILPHWIVIGYWIWQSNPGIILKKSEISISTQGQFIIGNKTLVFPLLNHFKSWVSLIFSLYTNNENSNTYITRHINLVPQTITFQNSALEDTKSVMQIGSFVGGFEGFIYSFYMRWKSKINLNFLICNQAVLNNCIWNCSLDSFQNNSECQLCESKCSKGCSRSQGCSICLDPLCDICADYTSVCKQCKDNANLVKNNCACIEGYYWNATQDICEPCLDECKNCSNKFLCDQCKIPLSYNSGTCNCISGKYLMKYPALSSRNSTFSCPDCHKTCRECTGPGDNQCTSCNNSRILFNNSCICKTGTYEEDFQCKNCSEFCEQCHNFSSCFKCRSDFEIKDGLCKCPSKMYIDGGKCESCHQSCLECIGDSENSCIKCSEKFKLINNSTCVCLDGYFLDGEECISCYSKCKTCDTVNVCTSCKNPFEFIRLSCECPTGYYEQGLDCLPCHETCLTCSAGSPSSCLSCNNSYSFSLNTHTCDCFPNFYKFNNNCYPCKKFCRICKDSQSCSSCQYPFITSNDSCLCPSGQYLDYETCQNCHELCLECSGKSLNNCLSCKINFQLQSNSTCICENGYFLNGNECLKCHDSCLQCSAHLYYNCKECSNFLIQGMCFETCPLGYTEELKNCRLSNSIALNFIFDRKFPVLQELNTEIFAEKCFPESEIKAYDRKGVFFNGNNTCIIFNLSRPILGPSFWVYVWIKPLSFSEFLQFYSSEAFEFSLKVNQQMKYSVNLNKLMQNGYSTQELETKWNHLLFGLNFSKNTEIFIAVNGLLDPIRMISEFPYKDSNNSTLVLGSTTHFSSFFKGFIFSLQIFNTFVDFELEISQVLPEQSDGKSCKIHPITENDCLDECGPGEVFETINNCKACQEPCQNCSDSACLICENLNSFSCLECLTGYELRESVCLSCSPFQYFDDKFKRCYECQGLCQRCLSDEKCLACKNNSVLVDNLSCQCLKGFFFNETECLQIYFKAFLLIHFNNTFTIQFEKKLSSSLKKESLEISLNGASTIFKLLEIDLDNYLIDLVSSIPSNSTEDLNLKINFTQKLKSEENYLLNTEIIEGKLFNTQNTISIIEDQVFSDQVFSDQAKATAIAAGGVAFTSGVLSLNPIGVFNLLNLIEIFVYSLLFDVSFHPEFLNFINSLKASTKIPNLFPRLVKPSTNLPIKYEKFGITCSFFILNSASPLMILSFLIVLTMISRAFQKLRNEKLKKIGILLKKKLIFGYFLRFFIQFSFDLSVFSMMSIVYTERDELSLLFDVSASFIIFVSATQVIEIISLLLIFLLLMKAYRYGSDKEALNEILQEFNQDSQSTTHYYLLFIVRRLLASVLVVLTQDPFFQVTGSLTLTLTVIDKKVLFYLAVTKPFKCRRMLIFQILNEIHISGFYLTVLVCIAQENVGSLESSKVFIFFILSSLANNVIFNAFDGIFNIFQWIKRRCMRNVQVSPVIVIETGEVLKIEGNNQILKSDSKLH